MSLDQFSKKYPVGTPVRYFPISTRPDLVPTVIRSEPWELGGGQVVVKIAGRPGGVSIAHIFADDGA